MADHMTAVTAEQLRAELVAAAEQWKRDAAAAEESGDSEVWILCLRAAGQLNEVVARLSGMAAVPEGWKLVPIEPTVAMQDEGSQAANAEHGRHDCSSIGYGHAETVYRAMLAAAPEPPHV